MKGNSVSTMNDENANIRLAEIRQRLDGIDRRIAESVGDRFEAVRQVGELKRATGIPMMQKGRVDAVVSRATQFEADYNIPAGTLTAIFSTLVAEACRLEDGIIGQDSE
ncbi:isochorismate pyruvate lyase [Amycolatopsis cihanbeyliensis]|uniref:Isochorismate pyruvate lyase n=2 Tax=Amycolatopsis cihanbeyliensis TaxID=1128664 RepID=A0A542DEY5_AMYCI|nr:isochorismate pyruvate lyase [Amycolatopsis cihanbeyliensis]